MATHPVFPPVVLSDNLEMIFKPRPLARVAAPLHSHQASALLSLSTPPRSKFGPRRYPALCNLLDFSFLVPHSISFPPILPPPLLLILSALSPLPSPIPAISFTLLPALFPSFSLFLFPPQKRLCKVIFICVLVCAFSSTGPSQTQCLAKQLPH